MPSGCILYTAISVPCCRPANGVLGVLYTTSAWGFRRCSFRQIGQCESLYSVERATEYSSHAFFIINLFRRGAGREKEKNNGNGYWQYPSKSIQILFIK